MAHGSSQILPPVATLLWILGITIIIGASNLDCMPTMCQVLCQASYLHPPETCRNGIMEFAL